MSYIRNIQSSQFLLSCFLQKDVLPYLMLYNRKILGKATTALSEGLMAKIQGTGSIDFGKIGSILCLCLVCICAVRFSLYPGMDHDRDHTESVLPAQKRNLRKNQPHADEILREPYLRRGIVPYHQRCRYVGTGTEPEYYHNHYIRCNTDRRACDDAQYFTAYDTYCTCDLTDLHGSDRICDKKSQKYFRASRSI